MDGDLRNGTQLIAYADRFGGDGLATLQGLLTGPLEGHVLPFFTPYDGADAGFDPADHRMVDPRLGDWSAIEAISRTHDVTADLIVNHISIESPQFVDFVAKGDSSRYAGMFLQVDDVFPDGITGEALERIYRPRLAKPFTEVALSDGSTRLMWTTFSSEQIDLDNRIRHVVGAAQNPHGRVDENRCRPLKDAALAENLLGEMRSLTPYRNLLYERYGAEIASFAAILFGNLLAAFSLLSRRLLLKNTGEKLAHLEKQLRSGRSISEELSRKIAERS